MNFIFDMQFKNKDKLKIKEKIHKTNIHYWLIYYPILPKLAPILKKFNMGLFVFLGDDGLKPKLISFLSSTLFGDITLNKNPAPFILFFIPSTY